MTTNDDNRMADGVPAMDVSGLAWENAERTQLSAAIDGERWSGITAEHRFWEFAVTAILDGATVRDWVPPPEPTPEERRREAYERECDPLLVAALGYRLEAAAGQAGAREKADAMEADYLAKKAEIRNANP